MVCAWRTPRDPLQQSEPQRTRQGSGDLRGGWGAGVEVTNANIMHQIDAPSHVANCHGVRTFVTCELCDHELSCGRGNIDERNCARAAGHRFADWRRGSYRAVRGHSSTARATASARQRRAIREGACGHRTIPTGRARGTIRGRVVEAARRVEIRQARGRRLIFCPRQDEPRILRPENPARGPDGLHGGLDGWMGCATPSVFLSRYYSQGSRALRSRCCAMARLRWLKSGAHAALAEQPAPCHFAGMEWRNTGRPAKRPGIIEPCIPTRADKPPVGPQCVPGLGTFSLWSASAGPASVRIMFGNGQE
jgi:hypothetical protein